MTPRWSRVTRAAAEVDPPPVGETGEEISGAAAFEAISRNFELMTGSARERVSVTSIRAERVGRWIAVTVTFRDRPENEVVFRLSDHWASRLYAQLGKHVR